MMIIKNKKIDEAYLYYRTYIKNDGFIELLSANNLKVAGCVPSVSWELFGAILTGRQGNGYSGADLQGWEIKSAVDNASFEYQYHLNSGGNKLEEDCVVNHLFCSYSRDYNNVIVRAMPGNVFKLNFYETWSPQYSLNYNTNVEKNERRQRFRKSISASFVKTHAKIILKIENKVLCYRDDGLLERLNSCS